MVLRAGLVDLEFYFLDLESQGKVREFDWAQPVDTLLKKGGFHCSLIIVTLTLNTFVCLGG